MIIPCTLLSLAGRLYFRATPKKAGIFSRYLHCMVVACAESLLFGKARFALIRVCLEAATETNITGIFRLNNYYSGTKQTKGTIVQWKIFEF